MTSKELVLRAIAGEETERTPWVPFAGVHSASLIGCTATEFLKDADKIVQGQSLAIERYQADGIPVVFDLQIEAEVLGCELNWSEDNPPAVVSHPLGMEVGRALSDLHIPQPHEGRLPVALEATRRLRESHPDVALYGLITGPFTLALHLLGTEIFLQMFDQGDKVQSLLAFCCEVGKAVASFYIDAGCDVIAVVDPMTSQIGPEQFREFCTPHTVPIFEMIRERGRRSSFFVCGHAQQNIEAMCECRCDNVSIDENIPLDYVRDVCRSRGVSFGGNLQLTVVLLTGTVDDCKRNTVECMEIGGASGFILAPGCDIPFATPPENLEAVARVVHDPYEHQVALELAKKDVSRQLAFDMSEYGASDRVIVDIITLDSEACAPCQYMVESVKEIAPEFEGLVVWREHKIKYRESIAFMSSLMVHNIPTICIDGQITFVSRIPKRDELIAAIQRRINEKLRTRIETKTNVIQVLGPPTEECLQVRELVRRAILELGANVSYQEVEDPASYQHLAVSETPAVAVVRQKVKSMGKVPSLVAVKEWLKQLEA